MVALRENKTASSLALRRKGATAAAVMLMIVLSLAAGSGACWFFMAGSQAKAREALDRAEEERQRQLEEHQRQSRQALSELQLDVKPDLESAAAQLERLNYGSALEEIREAIGKCDLVLNVLMEKRPANRLAE